MLLAAASEPEASRQIASAAAAAQGAFDRAPRSREGAALQAPRHVARGVPARLAGRAHAELRGRQAQQLELPVVGVAGALVAHPIDRGARVPRRSDQRALHPRAYAGRWGSQPEAAPAPHLVEGERPAQPPAQPPRAHPARQRQGAEVVRRSRVDPLLRTGRHQPHVAARPQPLQARRQRHDHSDPRCVVVGPRSGRRGVRVGHHDAQAAARRVEDPDHVSRPARARHSKALDAHAEPGGAKTAGHQPVCAPLGTARRRTRSDARDPHRISMRAHRLGEAAGDRLSRRRAGAGRGQRHRCRESEGRTGQPSSSRSSPGSVTGCLQAKPSHT
jgi:hypothetical protein